MKYPTLNSEASSRDMLSTFRGYNHTLTVGSGEFYDMQNLTSDYYPILSPRKKRGTLIAADGDNINGMISKDALCYVKGTKLYINQSEVSGLTLEDSEKQLVSMGAYLIIFPDKKWINTKDLTDYGSIDAEFVTTTTVTYSMCNVDGEAYSDATISNSEPPNPTNLDYWIDTSTTPHTLKQYSDSSSIWIAVPTTYIKISAHDIAVNFSQYDGVTLTGLDSANIPQLADLEGQTSILYQVYHDPGSTEVPTRPEGTDDYIVVVGFLDTVGTQDTSVIVSRKSPDMDFVIESENRLWGCKYGISDGKVLNEIYACKLGDFKNWSCFMGIASDSYAASCGTDGAFTGAVSYLGYPLFFKETCLHKVYGNYPSNYQIQTTTCRGVRKGSGKSLAIVNEVLYYKSRNGVCAYDGSLPTEMSVPFGDEQYADSVAGGNRGKYYISMKNGAGGYDFFVYDTAKGLWHKEDTAVTEIKFFCSHDGEMYYSNGATIKCVNGSAGGCTQESADVEWMALTGNIGTDYPDKKWITRLTIRLSVQGTVSFYAFYDGVDARERLATVTGTNERIFALPVRPKRCDHFQLQIEGTGNAKIYSITKTMETGSDV